MTKQEQIVAYIEQFISNYVDDEIILSVSDIYKWPCVAALCERHDSANICKAMQKVKYGKWFISGKNDSSSYTIMFSRNIQNAKTEDYSSESEIKKAITEIDAKYVTYKNNQMKIHYADCPHIFHFGGGVAGYYTIHLNYKSAKKYADLKDFNNWNCKDCEKKHGKMK